MLTFPVEAELKGSYTMEFNLLREIDMIRLFILSMYAYQLFIFFDWTKASQYYVDL